MEKWLTASTTGLSSSTMSTKPISNMQVSSEAGKWIIGHYLGDFDTPITSVNASIETDEEYSIELRVYGAEVELFVGGILF